MEFLSERGLGYKGLPGNPGMLWDKRDAQEHWEGRWKMLISQELIPKSTARKCGIPGSDPKDLCLTVAIEEYSRIHIPKAGRSSWLWPGPPVGDLG